MFRAKLSTVRIALLVGASVWIGGCASTNDDKTANWSPNRLYAEAKDEMNSGSYDKATALLEKLEGRAAGTPLAQQAQLDKAEAEPALARAINAEAPAVIGAAAKMIGARVIRDDGEEGLALGFEKLPKETARALEKLVACLPDVESLEDSEVAGLGSVISEILD